MKIVLGISSISETPRLNCCVLSVLLLSVGGSGNVHLPVCSCHDFFYFLCAFGNRVAPLCLCFIMLLSLCKRSLQVLNLCQADAEKVVLWWNTNVLAKKKKKKETRLPWNLIIFFFLAYSVFGVYSWSFCHNIQPSFTNVVALSKELCAGRVHRSNIFPDVCGHTGVCFSLEITGKILRFTGDDLNLNSLKFSLKVKLFNSTAKGYHYWV